MLDQQPALGAARRPARRARGRRSRSRPATRASRWPRTRRFAEEPLPLLLEGYERFGPIFTLRLFHSNVVFMLGPGGQPLHHSSPTPRNFLWREGHFRDLIGLMGDGLLTIDGDFHRRSRRIMLPAFHREHIAASVDDDRRRDRARARRSSRRARRSTSTPGRAGWRCASRCARCSASTPTARGARDRRRRRCSSRRSPSTRRDYLLRILRGRGTPWARMQQAARKLDTLIYAEISARRAHRRARRGHPQPAARRRGRGRQHAQRPADPRRGHDAAVRRPRHDHLDGLLHVLRARPPPRRSPTRLLAEQDAQLRGGAPERRAADSAASCRELEMVLDETLRKYPPAWIGPRARSSRSSSQGTRSRRDAFVNYCSWACHHLPDVFAEPEAFRPERFAPEAQGGAPEGRLRARSAAARARASGCASASSRSARSPR